MSDDSNSLRREFAADLAAAKEAVKNDLRHENAAMKSTMEANMSTLEERMDKRTAEQKAYMEGLARFMMVFIVAVAGVTLAIARYLFAG